MVSAPVKIGTSGQPVPTACDQVRDGHILILPKVGFINHFYPEKEMRPVYIFLALLFAIALGLLWLPSLIVLAFVKNLPMDEVVRRGCLVWLIQPPLAIALILLADAMGLTNPGGLVLAISAAVGCAGAIFFWKLDPRQ